MRFIPVQSFKAFKKSACVTSHGRKHLEKLCITKVGTHIISENLYLLSFVVIYVALQYLLR